MRRCGSDRRRVSWSSVRRTRACIESIDRGQDPVYFDDNALSDRLTVSNFISEESGSFADSTELSVSEIEQELRFSGTGTVAIPESVLMTSRFSAT